MYTWEFDKNSKLIRAYVWLWEADESSINFCKLFWGTLFCWVGLFLKALKPLFERLEARLNRREQAVRAFHQSAEYMQAQRIKRELKEARGPNRAQRCLTSIGAAADKVAALCQTKPIKLLGKVFAVLVSVAAAGALVFSMVVGWKVWLVLLAIAAIAVALIGLVALIASVISPSFVEKIRNGGRFVGAFLGEGFHSVKHRTCPVVVVRDE